MATEVGAENTARGIRREWRIRQVLREALTNFFTQDSLMVSASVAYHTLLATFPLLLLLLGLSGIAIRHYELSGQLAVVLERYLPMKPDFIMRNLVGISQAYGRVGVVSFLLLLWSSSGVFLPIEKALNNAWGVKEVRSWWKRRLLALEMALILGFLILASSALVGVNAYIHNWMVQRAFRPAGFFWHPLYHLLILTSTFGMTLAMFLVLFERLTYRDMRIRQVFPGALLTAIFWEAARTLFTLLLPRFNYRLVYGSIGAVVALMTWAYISSAVMLFGAQVSRSLYGSLHPTPSAPASPPAPTPVHSAGDVR